MLKLTLMIALFGSTVMADGDMGTGGYQCPPEGCQPPPCTVDCGGAAMQSGDTESDGVTTEQDGHSLESIAIDLVERSYLLFTF